MKLLGTIHGGNHEDLLIPFKEYANGSIGYYRLSHGRIKARRDSDEWDEVDEDFDKKNRKRVIRLFFESEIQGRWL